MRLRHFPLALGHWALVELPSGETVCVDAETLEAVAYVQGRDHEGDVVRVFRTFLRRRSVVLDIGANVGLYTAVAGRVVVEEGRLFAFEGNPRAFAALERTLVANGLFNNPRIVAVNLLVSDRCGRGTLYYSAGLPSGGTMSDVPLLGGERRSVEVDMTTIDAFLPADLAVDLAKIDVEGHEPLVIRGMERVIARSPNIRLVIEFVDDFMLAHGVKPGDFVDELRALGFEICRLLPKFQLRLVPPGEAITGFNYLLLTRTAEADIAAVERRRRSPPRRFKRWLARRRRAWARYRGLWRHF